MKLQRKRIALLIETSTTWGRGLIRGIARYAREEANWALTIEPRGTHEKTTLPYNWRGDGVIGRLTTHEIVDDIKRAGVPAVNVSQISIPDSPFPKLTTSETRVGQIAASHLLDRSFRSLGYYGPPHREHYTDQIYEAFKREATRKRVKVSTFQPDRFFTTSHSSHDDLVRLGPWLEELEKPAGILTWNGIGAYRVMSACELLGIEIPKEIGVLSGEHDELMAAISGVSLSGIDHSPNDVGWHAAAELDQILIGDPMTPTERFINPSGIRIGDSTERAAARDSVVESALEMIRNNPKGKIGVAELAKHAGLSRRALEVRFNKVLGRSPGAEMRLIRLDHAAKLLATGNLSITEIAEESGFRSIDSFSRAFAARYGISPRSYRKRHVIQTSPS